jgi:signal transduction histidine kinase
MNKLENDKLTGESVAEKGELTKELEEKYYRTIEEIAHELRNPLTAMMTSVYLLKKAVKESIADANKYIHQIEDSIIRSDNIINNILTKYLPIRHKD